jgi:hypothetical protein
MTNGRNTLALAVIAVASAEALAIWLAFLVPDRRAMWLVAGLTMPLLWAGAEVVRRDKDSIRHSVAVAAMLIALPLAVFAARAQGLIAAEDAALGVRLLGIATGLIIAAYGNVIPRRLVCIDPMSPDAARRQKLQRFCGWLFVLAGLANAAIWAVAPVKQAALWSMVPLAGALILVAMRFLRKVDLQRGGV